jgi:adenine-specific DNA methylase
LIEVDLPIKTISEHAQHEQNLKKGHLHSMHIWWATRPLAACRAVTLATLLPDPVDPNCPKDFKQRASKLLIPLSTKSLTNDIILRQSLLRFIGDLSAWENSVDRRLIHIARELVKAVYPDQPPLIVDPFAGMGSISFEALRLGADSFASDLNPVATLILKTGLEYIPTYGLRLAKEVRRWGEWVRKQATQKLQEFYPIEQDGSIPLSYIWARTIRCEGPGCGAELPLVGLLWLSLKDKVALRYRANKERQEVVFEIFNPRSENEVQKGIVKRLTATCPVCGYTTPYKRVREQISTKHEGLMMQG